LLEQIVKKILEEQIQFPYQLYSLKVNEKTGNSSIEIIIDNLENKYGSISIEECERFSRILLENLERENSENHEFSISVSSVGAERILQIPEDLLRFTGLDAKFTYKSVDGKQKDGNFNILRVEGDEVFLAEYGKKNFRKIVQREIHIKIQDLIKGNLIIII